MVLGLAALFCVNGCDDPVQPAPPALELSGTTIPVSSEGGTYSVGYKVSNPRDGAEISVSEPGVDWVTDIEVTADEISFFVAENGDAAERSVTVSVSYPGISEDAGFTIIQDAGEPAPFTIEVRDITSNSAVFDVIPYDKEMFFVCFYVPQSYLDENNISTDEALYADDKLYMETILSSGYSIEELVYQGDELTGVGVSGLSPESDQVIYAYGIDIGTLEPLTEIIYARFTTLAPEMVDATFTFGEPEVDGPVVSVSVTPEGYDGWWSVYAFETATLDPSESMFDHCSSVWNGEMELWLDIIGYTPDMVLPMFCYQGPQDLQFTDLTPNTDYNIVAFAVGDDCVINSEPVILEVTTGSVAASDNRIDINVTDITGSTARIEFTAENNDPWAFNVYAASDFEGMSDEEILSACAADGPNATSGSRRVKYTGLSPLTEYLVVAFGYDSGAATTGLFKETFTTDVAVTGPIEFELQFGDYYDAAGSAEALRAAGHEADAAAIEASVAGGVEVFLPAVPVTTPEVGTYYYGLLPDKSENHLEDASGYIPVLVQNGSSEEAVCFTLKYDEPMFAIGVAFDDLGEPGPVWVGESFTLSKDGVSDPQGFVDYLYPTAGESTVLHTAGGDVGSADGFGTCSLKPASLQVRPVYTGGEAKFALPDGRGLSETGENIVRNKNLSGRTIFRK